MQMYQRSILLYFHAAIIVSLTRFLVSCFLHSCPIVIADREIANGHFNAYGNAARKDNQDYFVRFSGASHIRHLNLTMHRYILVTISTRMQLKENVHTNRLDYCLPCTTIEPGTDRFVRYHL